jgi:hypothetical protein
VADKVERVAKLARWLVEEGIVGSGVPAKAGTQNGMTQSGSGLLPTQEHERAELADLAEQAARLAKADLVTEMVGEFPELQGLMGGYYAHAEGLPDAVADAIRDHYKPVGQGDDVPIAPVTVAVSLADKLDSLIHFFAVGERPSGSRDPFALRRAALGVISTIITNDIRLSLNKFFQIVLPEIGYMQGWQQAGKEFAALEAALEASLLSDEQKLKFIMDNPFNVQDLEQSELYRKTRDAAVAALQQFVDFCADRLKVQQKEAGVRHDLIDAVFALGGEDDLVRLLARVRALQGFIETPDGANLLAGYKRAANILKKEGVETQTVIPAEAGIQPPPTELDSRVRGNDGEYSAAAFSHSQTHSATCQSAARLGALGRARLDAGHDGHGAEPRPQRRDGRRPGQAVGRRALRLGQLSPLHPDVFRRRARLDHDVFEEHPGRLQGRPRLQPRHRSGAEDWKAWSALQGAGREANWASRSRRIRRSSSGARSARCSLSWMNERAVTYRRSTTSPESWGTAVNVQAMVFGNMGETPPPASPSPAIRRPARSASTANT